VSPRFAVALPWRLGLFYAALFGVVGVQFPFWPLYLSGKGLGPSGIGAAVAASYLVRVLSNPLAGMLADRMNGRRRLLLILSLASAAATALFFAADAAWALILVTVLSYAFFSAMLPLADNLSLLCVARHGLDYGRIRLGGSLGFITLSLLGGQWLIGAPNEAIPLACIGMMLLCWAAAWFLPEPDIAADPDRKPGHAWPLLKAPSFILFLAAASLIQLSHIIYYGFASLHWRAAGLSGGIIGGLWAEGVAAEMLLFALGMGLARKLGPVRLLALGACGAALRWAVLGSSVDPMILASVQGLHALSFGATHLGAMLFISRAVPADISAAGQGIYASVAMGVVPGLGFLAAGELYRVLEGRAFLVMALCALAGLAVARALSRRWDGGPIRIGAGTNA